MTAQAVPCDNNDWQPRQTKGHHMRLPRSRKALQQRIEVDRAVRRERVIRDMERYGGEVLDSEEMQEAFHQVHHGWATVGEHTLRVTVTSLLICYTLKKMNVKVNIPAVVVGALCHDLGMVGLRDKCGSLRELNRAHPKESVQVARELVEELPEKTEEIIERHMWPAGDSQPPDSIEGVVVSVADKYNTVKDFVKGSEVKHTGVRNVVREQREKLVEAILKDEQIDEIVDEIVEEIEERKGIEQ